MKLLHHIALGLVLVNAVVPIATGVEAAAHELKLPGETAKLRPSTLPGYPLAIQKCGICHSADYINYQPPGMSQAQWTTEMAKMQHAYGAPINDEEVQQIGAYLAVAYGTAKASDADIVSASVVAKPTTAMPVETGISSAAGTSLEANALLVSNGCLACHAIDRKVVGPAYHEVAVKYKSDPHALANVETSIRQGGVGQWGQTPMPPFPGLSNEQVKALASFVLVQ